MAEPSQSPLRIAILGGGMAGAATFRGLAKHKHLQVDIFESASAFREEGAGILLNPVAAWAVELLELNQCLVDAGAVKLDPTYTMIGQGPDKGKKLFDVDMAGKRDSCNVKRAAFLEKMYEGINPAQMHAGKKLVKLKENGEIHLHFEDGTTHACDVVLGADGLHSKIRPYVVPEEAVKPTFAGFWVRWDLVPYEKAVECLGDELLSRENSRQYGWVGDGNFVMHDLVSNMTLAQYILSERVPEENNPTEYTKTATHEEVRAMLKGWEPPLEQGIFDMATHDGKPVTMFPLWHHLTVPTISSGRVALVGDAAGATCPWQASGGGMALTDAFMLSELFAHVGTVAQATAALQAYDFINRPIRARIIKSSYEVGLMIHGAFPGVGMDSQKLTDAMQDRWKWIWSIDLLQNRDAAIEKMQQALR